jgi:predicted nucleotidyltransferase
MLDKLKILRELKQLLQEHFHDDIQDVVLFGSQVTGNASEISDYDVLIILRNEYDWKYKKALRYLCYDIALKYDIFLDIKVISLHELHHTIQGKNPLFIDALEHGVFA